MYLSDFIYLFDECEELYKPFDKLRESLIDTFIGKDDYMNITSRIYYYDDPCLGIPKESCLKKTIRILIAHQPPPLHSDYIEIDYNSKRQMNAITNKIRGLYGYSHRMISSIGHRSGNSPSFMLSLFSDIGSEQELSRIKNHIDHLDMYHREFSTNSNSKITQE